MNNIASRLSVGSVSALDWGWRLMQIPQTLIGTAMGIVIFPTLAALSEVRDLDGKRDAMSGALALCPCHQHPVRGGLDRSGQAAHRTSGTRRIRRRGIGAGLQHTEHVYAWANRAFRAGGHRPQFLRGQRHLDSPVRGARRRRRSILAFAILLSDVSTVDSRLFANSIARAFPVLGYEPYIGRVSGLALANSLGVMFEVLCLLLILRRRWRGIREGSLASSLLKSLVASLVMAGTDCSAGHAVAGLGAVERSFVHDRAPARTRVCRPGRLRCCRRPHQNARVIRID